MNITSVHLSAFVYSTNIFIRYSSKQSTSELSLIVTEMISTMVFLPREKLSINVNKFRGCLLKTYNLYTF